MQGFGTALLTLEQLRSSRECRVSVQHSDLGAVEEFQGVQGFGTALLTLEQLRSSRECRVSVQHY